MNPSSQVFQHQAEAVNSLKQYFDFIDVITSEPLSEKAQSVDGISVFSLNWSVNRPFKNFFKLLFVSVKVAIRAKPDMVFFHMTDVHSALLAPIFRICRIPNALWYAHAHLSIWLALSFKWNNKLFTPSKGSLPISSRKVYCIGHHINTHLFDFNLKRLESNGLKLIHVGRLDRSKKIEEMMAWAENSKFRSSFVKFVFVGAPTLKGSEYVKTLQNKYQQGILQGFFDFAGQIDRVKLPTILPDFSVFVHMCNGSLDKSILEATSMGLPVITLNEQFISEFGRWGDDMVPSLENEIEALLSLNDEARDREIMRRYRVLVENHSLDVWSKKISASLMASKHPNY